MSPSVLMHILAGLAGLAAAFGVLQAMAGVAVVRRFASRPRTLAARRAPVTVLKPLHGGEPMLRQALASFCAQDYPEFQLVFGVAHASDPALAVVAELRAEFPRADIAVVIDPAQHGCNRKVSNLINMLPAARHDLLVIADSDLHVTPDYLDRVVAELAQPGAGLVTTLCIGWAAAWRLPERLGASQITYTFLPGALMARALGRQDCLGVTMALRRRTLERVGGLRALVNHVADDAALGRLVCAQGLDVRLANTLPATTVSDATLMAGFQHELRWARTIRSLAPAGFAASALQYPIAWGLAAALLSAGAGWSLLLCSGAWAARSAAAGMIDRALLPMARPGGYGQILRARPWIMPLREAMSVAVMAASYRSRNITWRGHAMQIGAPPPTREAARRHADALSGEGAASSGAEMLPGVTLAAERRMLSR